MQNNNSTRTFWNKPLLSLLMVGSLCCGAAAQGIVEPNLIFYGTVRNTNSGANVRWNFGTLTWTIQPAGGGSPVVVSANLTNINDQFCYMLEVPCETSVGGNAVSSNVLQLTSSRIAYDRSMVMVNGTNRATIVAPGSTTFSVSSLNRGQIERLDLDVSIPLTDKDGNGLPDDWERYYFGKTGLDPESIGANGMTLFESYKSGNNPNDTNSVFKIIQVAPNPGGGMSVLWKSRAFVFYAVQRSFSVTRGFSDIAVGIPATTPTNIFWDASATKGPAIFYRLRLDRVFIGGLDADGNGLPDDWERLYFGHIGVDPNADADGDGMSNLEEYKAGTNPIDASSNLKFVNITSKASGSVVIEWSSIYGKTYSILRSTDPRTGYLVIQSGIAATPPVNQFTDTPVPGSPHYSYRVLLGP